MSFASDVERARRMVAEKRTAEAIALLESAGARGDVDALMQLAVWHLAGDPVARDLPAARALLRRAVEIGHVDAALMEVALAANGSGSVPSWSDALALLKTAAGSDPLAAEQLRLVEAMRLDGDGKPVAIPAARILGEAPRVSLFERLLTPEECGQLAQVGNELMEPGLVVDPATGRQVAHPVRRCDTAVIGPARENLVVRAVNLRIAAISETGVDQGEALTVLRYAPGQEYRLHHDGLPGVANQRLRTVIVYLNQGFQGGETVFPANGLKVAPRGGDAIMFDNCLGDGSIDPLSRHAGLPIVQGAKWIATRWIRQAPLDVWSQSQPQ